MDLKFASVTRLRFYVRLLGIMRLPLILQAVYTIVGALNVAHLLYFMCPLIETNNPRFSNIRKVGIAVFVEVTSGNKDPFVGSRCFPYS